MDPFFFFFLFLLPRHTNNAIHILTLVLSSRGYGPLGLFTAFEFLSSHRWRGAGQVNHHGWDRIVYVSQLPTFRPAGYY